MVTALYCATGQGDHLLLDVESPCFYIHNFRPCTDGSYKSRRVVALQGLGMEGLLVMCLGVMHVDISLAVAL